MEILSHTLNELESDLQKVGECLRVVLHSILFQRELGLVKPQQIRSSLGLSYYTLDDFVANNAIEQFLQDFEKQLVSGNSYIVKLSFYKSSKSKAFLVEQNKKLLWEQWEIPLNLFEETHNTEELAEALRDCIVDIVRVVDQSRNSIPFIDNFQELITFPFELSYETN